MSNVLRIACAMLVAAVASIAQQQITPHAGYVYPAGGRQGATFEVIVGGQFLDGAASVLVSGGGVQATVVEHVKPLTPAQANTLRDQLKELMAKRAAAAKTDPKREAAPAPVWKPEDEKTVEDIRKKLATFVRRPSSPAIAETVRVKIEVSPGAAPGDREIRLQTNLGLTNPLLFSVGQLPEYSKAPAKVFDEQIAARVARFRPATKSEGPVEIALPAVVNGQIVPGAIDCYRFRAAKGQHIVAEVQARELIPYISDAVPGWFQAALALHGPDGREVEYAGSYRFHPDPVLEYDVPADGEYTIVIRDSIYRGREDFVYRISIGELPFVTGIFPLGGKQGTQTALQLKGWNLPAAKLTEDSRRRQPGVYTVGVRAGGLLSNSLPFAVGTMPERLEREPNNQPKKSEQVKLPVIVNGRIDGPGDWDVFRFKGRAGDEIVAEVQARRLDSPLDSVLKLTNAAGKQIAFNDDSEDKGSGLLTHHADSMLRAKLPANGVYYVHIGDAQGKGGPEYAYRLRISRPEPDFALRVVPASVNIRGGGTAAITVCVLRRDGFSGEIALRLTDAPSGFTLSGGRIPAGVDKVRLTLTSPPGQWDAPLRIGMEGRATIEGKEVARAAVPAEDMMQAFAYRHLVPAKEWMIYVAKAGRFRAPWKIETAREVELPAGGTAPVRLLLPRSPMANQLQFVLNEPPEGIAIQRVTPRADGIEILLHADSGKAKPGLRGNLIVDAFVTRPAGKQANQRRQPVGTLPAIPFEVVAAR